MALYKRTKNGKELGPWYYLFYIEGKRFTGSTGTANERDAVKVEALDQLHATHPAPGLPQSFEEKRPAGNSGDQASACAEA